MYKESFGENGLLSSSSNYQEQNQIMILDASTTLIDNASKVFITCTDEDDKRTVLNNSKTRNKINGQTQGLP